MLPKLLSYNKTILGVKINVIQFQCHFLKTDFNKWKDEDETDDEDESGR